MITLNYPLQDNPRSYPRGVAAFGECVPYIFDTNGALISGGAYPTMQITVPAATGIANGSIITIDGVEIITDDTIVSNTATTINLQGTSLENAQRLMSVLMSNAHFSDYYIETVLVGTTYNVVLTGKVKKEGFVVGTTIVPSPLVAVGVAGAAPEMIEGYGLVYQVFTEGADGFPKQIFPELGQWQLIEPAITSRQRPNKITIEVQDIISCLVSTTIPSGCFNSGIGSLDNNRARFWIRYGYKETIDCASVIRGVTDSMKEWVYLAAVNAKDYGGLNTYGYGAASRKFLTRRCSPCVCRTACDWLYVLIDDYEAGYSGTPMTVYTSISSDGITYSFLSVRELPEEDGVYFIPSGASTIGVPANIKYYQISLTSSDGTLITQNFEITDCDCEMLVYFLNDLGAFEYLQFKKQFSRTIDVEKNVSCVHLPCTAKPLTGGDYFDFTRGNTRKVTNVKGTESMTLVTDWAKNSECTSRLMQAFAMSPQYYIVHPTGIVPTFLAAMIESVKVDTISSEGKTRLEIDIYIQREINGII